MTKQTRWTVTALVDPLQDDNVRKAMIASLQHLANTLELEVGSDTPVPHLIRMDLHFPSTSDYGQLVLRAYGEIEE